MREKTLNLLGLMRKANAIAVGETNTGGAVRIWSRTAADSSCGTPRTRSKNIRKKRRTSTCVRMWLFGSF